MRLTTTRDIRADAVASRTSPSLLATTLPLCVEDTAVRALSWVSPSRPAVSFRLRESAAP